MDLREPASEGREIWMAEERRAYPDPAEWAARKGPFVGMWSNDDYRYADAELDRWVQEVTTHLKDHSNFRALQGRYMSDDEADEVNKRAAEGWA